MGSKTQQYFALEVVRYISTRKSVRLASQSNPWRVTVADFGWADAWLDLELYK